MVKGETLRKIAEKYCADPSLCRNVFEADRELLKDPKLMQIGWKLPIP